MFASNDRRVGSQTATSTGQLPYRPPNPDLRILLPAPKIFRPAARKRIEGVAELHTLTHRAPTAADYPLSLTKEYSELESRSLEGLKDLKFDFTDFPSQICNRKTDLSRARNSRPNRPSTYGSEIVFRFSRSAKPAASRCGTKSPTRTKAKFRSR